jgi:hypothetical protein
MCLTNGTVDNPTSIWSFWASAGLSISLGFISTTLHSQFRCWISNNSQLRCFTLVQRCNNVLFAVNTGHSGGLFIWVIRFYFDFPLTIKLVNVNNIDLRIYSICIIISHIVIERGNQTECYWHIYDDKFTLTTVDCSNEILLSRKCPSWKLNET